MGMRGRVAGALVVVALVGVAAYRQSGGDDRGESMRAGIPNTADTVSSGDRYGFDKAAGEPVSAALTAGGPGAGGVAAAGGGAVPDDAATGTGAPLSQGLGAPKVIKTAVLELEVAEGGFAVAFSKVPSIGAALGGFVSSSTSTQAGDGEEARQAAGSVVLRVPAEQFDTARTELLKLGDLTSQQVKGDDVSAQLTDLDARLRNHRSQEEAIRLLMAKTTTIGETIEVQRQLGSVREQIEQLAAEQARLSDAVAMSTITVHLAEPGAATNRGSEPSPLGEALSRAVRGAQQVLAGTIVAVGYLLPLALLLAAGWLLARPIRARLSST